MSGKLRSVRFVGRSRESIVAHSPEIHGLTNLDFAGKVVGFRPSQSGAGDAILVQKKDESMRRPLCLFNQPRKELIFRSTHLRILFADFNGISTAYAVVVSRLACNPIFVRSATRQLRFEGARLQSLTGLS